jgi:hypothetical protein
MDVMPASFIGPFGELDAHMHEGYVVLPVSTGVLR